MEPQKSICHCPTIPINSTQSSLDNSNSSSALRFSERLRSRKPRKVFQGQPTRLEIYRATFTTARIHFQYIGSPVYYDIVAYSTVDRHTYQFTHKEFLQYSYLTLTGMTPNTLYTVELYATYISGDRFPVNHFKTFRTSYAEGKVKDLTLINPTNQNYYITDPSYNTSFTLQFSPLNDYVDYRISVTELDYQATIPYADISNIELYQHTFTDLSFNHTYNVTIETLYGVSNDRYIYSVSGSITTLNEQYLSQLELLYLYNTSVDLSYSKIHEHPIDNVSYQVFLDDIERTKHASYLGDVTLSNLSINQTYNSHVAIVFHNSKNTYHNVQLPLLNFTTLNESETQFTNIVTKNTSIELNVEDASGTPQYEFTIVPDDGASLNWNPPQLIFTDLSINTTYTIEARTIYPPITSPPNETDISNVYTIQTIIHTLNQGPVTNLQAREIKDVYSNVRIDFSPAPAFQTTGEFYQVQLDNYDYGGSFQTVDNIHPRFTSYTFTNIDSGLYKYRVSSVYKPTSTYPSYDYIIDGTIDVETLQPGYLGIERIETFGTSITLIKDNDPTFKTNHIYYNIDISTNTLGLDSLYLANVKTWTGDSHTITGLLPNTQYNYSIIAGYINNLDTYETTGSFTTLEENQPTMTNVIISYNSIELTWSAIGTSTTYELMYSTASQSDVSFSLQGEQTKLLTGLNPNTSYYITLIVTYNITGNQYANTFSFTTLHQSPPVLKTFILINHPQSSTNVSIIKVIADNDSAVEKYEAYLDGDNGGIQINQEMILANPNDKLFSLIGLNPNQTYSGNVKIYYQELEPNPDPIISYSYPTFYQTDFSFTTIMRETIVSVYNDAIQMNWMDLSTNEDLSYNIQITDPITGYTDISTVYNVTNYFLGDLTRNTQYDISFTRLYPDSPDTIFQSVTTLNEGPVESLDQSIVLNTGINGNLVVLDISNINPNEVKQNTFFLTNGQNITSKGTDLMDIQVDNTTTDISGIIFTYYKTDYRSNEFNPYVIPTTKTYISQVFSFSLGSLQTPTLLENPTLEPVDGQTYHPTTGMRVNALPKDWSGNSVFVVDNSNNDLYGHKYLDDPDDTIVQHVGLYYNNQSNGPAFLSQKLQSNGYLFQNYYEIMFQVANHLTGSIPYTGANELPYQSGTTSSTVEYQIQLLNEKGLSVYESNPIRSNSTNWKRIQMRFHIPQSHRDISLRIQRNFFELNHLYLSDFSMVTLNAVFDPLPSLQYFPSQWVVSNSYDYTPQTWNTIYNTGSEPVLQLSTNMTVSFWLYVHNVVRDTQRGLIVIGPSDANSIMKTTLAFYLRKNTIVFENNLHYYSQSKHTTTLNYNTNIPLFYQIVYQNNTISIYVNGILHKTTSLTDYLREATSSETITIGTPSAINPLALRGYLLNRIEFYNFPMTEIQANDVYRSMREIYSTVGNYYFHVNPYRISKGTNSTILSTTTMGSSGVKRPLEFTLHNNNILTKEVSFYPLQNQTVFATDTSWNTLIKPFSLGFWINNTSSNTEIMTINGLRILLTNDQMLLQQQQSTTLQTIVSMPIVKTKYEHITYVMDVSSTLVYKNGYLYDETREKTVDDISTVTQIVFGTDGFIGEFEIYNKALSQSEVLTAYVNHFAGQVVYNKTGFYRLLFPNVDGNTYNSIQYDITNIPPTVTSLSVDVSGTLVFETNDENVEQAVIDISMSPLELNEFHRNGSIIEFNLVDFGITTPINGGDARPYLEAITTITEAITTITEGNVVDLYLRNAPVDLDDADYQYTISGDVDTSDICGGLLQGSIDKTTNTVQIIVRDDYKTEDLENMIIFMNTMNLATTIQIQDTTQNLLSVSHTKRNINQIFTVTFTWPSSTDYTNEFPYVIVGNDFVRTVVTDTQRDPTPSTGIFTKTLYENGNYTNTIDFITTTEESQREFIFSLKNYDSSVTVILNDFDKPRVFIQPLDETNTTGAIDEGESFVIRLEVPLQFTEAYEFNYHLSGIQTSDISFSTDPNFNSDSLSGKFVLPNGGRDISYVFVSSENRDVEGDEKVFIVLADVSYNTIKSDTLSITNIFTAPTYVVNVAGDVSFNTTEGIYYIDEGQTFTITLDTSEQSENFNYNIIGNNVDVNDFISGATSGVLNSSNSFTEVFSIKNDTTTEGDEPFTFRLTLEGLNIDKYFKIVDKSQQMEISISSDNRYTRDNDPENTFIITVTNTNYSVMTEQQRGVSIGYKLYDIDNPTDTLGDDLIVERTELPFNGNNNFFQFGSSSTKVFTFDFTPTAAGRDLRFELTNYDNFGINLPELVYKTS